MIFNTTMTRIAVFTLFALALSLSGCLSNQPSKQVTQLNDQVKLYGKLIRWRGYEQAAGMLKTRDKPAPEVDHDLLKEIRVTAYEVQQIRLNEEQNEAVVIADISYYHERYNSVHSIEDVQLWWFDEKTGAWWLDGGLPDFKAGT